MIGKVFGKKHLKVLGISFAVLILLIPLLVAVNRHFLNDWNPQQPLVGKWSGKSEIFSDFKKGQSPSTFPEDLINIDITINDDGSVTGFIGDAEMENCKIQLNRNRFEKLLGIKTDYIVSGGFIKNGISDNDNKTMRDISILFDLIDGEIKGSIFEVEKWKYPDPLFPELTLKQDELND